MTSVFVFGSNLAGRHGKGAALYAAKNCGAVYGQGIGRQGDSYAIPTKDSKLAPLPVYIIKRHVDDFIEYAWSNPTTMFRLTAIGCGLAGYKAEDIAPLFKYAPRNVQKPIEFSLIDEHPQHEHILGARTLAAWIGYSWTGLHDWSVRDKGFPVWSLRSFSGGKEDLVRIVKKIMDGTS